MKARKQFSTLLAALLGAAAVASGQVLPDVASRWFDEVTKLCERDAGRLWGVSLCGSMVIVDQRTGTRATSRPEPEGPAPRLSGFADGPVLWGGERWFSFPLQMLAGDADVRRQNMLHGLFHRIQDQLGFLTGDDGSNEHLDAPEGRIWIQLEWRALRRAVESNGSRREEAISDALAFRRERRRLFPGATENERRDEIREGLASYTGIAAWAGSPAEAKDAAARALVGGDWSFVGNFEAASGPGYGVLLDELAPGWRKQLRGTSDLGDLLAVGAGVQPAADLAAAAARYEGAALRSAELVRDRARQGRLAELLRRFVDGPVLTIPGGGSGTSDTSGSVGIPGVGTVLFGNFTQQSQWGRLEASGGVLRSADGTTLSVPLSRAPEGTSLRGENWSAKLNSGWVARPTGRPGSFRIVRED